MSFGKILKNVSLECVVLDYNDTVNEQSYAIIFYGGLKVDIETMQQKMVDEKKN